MLKRLILIIILTFFLFPLNTLAKQYARVIVLPFEVNAPQHIANLKTEIPRVLKKHLKNKGAVIVEPDIETSWNLTIKALSQLRDIGVKNGAEYVVFGTLKSTAGKFSLSINLVQSFTNTPAQVFYKKGEGIESLPEMVKEVSNSLAAVMLNMEVIADLIITGNKRIESDAIKMLIKTKPGDIYVPNTLSDDLRAMYAMGYFEDIRIESRTDPKGKIVIFKVEEKPTIRKIIISGNKLYEEEQIFENITASKGRILNVFEIQNNAKQIEAMYKAKNYHKVNVAYKITKPEQNNWADLEFVIQEGKKFEVKNIIFKGNSVYTDDELKDLMKTSEKGFFSWLTSSGELNPPVLNQDISSIASFYHNNGYIDAKVSDPEIEYKEDSIEITIKLEEGLSFMVDEVSLSGDFILPEHEMLKILDKLNICQQEYFNGQAVRNDLLMLSDLYSDQGYAYANISPVIDMDKDKQLIRIKYSIKKGTEVYIDKINITGNTKTRDKVIRRLLNLYEQELYSGKKLKKGMRRLYRYDFFEDVKVDTSKGTSEDKMTLNINVTEKPTGSFIFGGGYSNQDEWFGMIEINQRNLFGRAQTLSLKGKLGGETDKYTLSFTEPWLFDIPLSAGCDTYKLSTEYDTYTKDSVGGGLRMGYSLFEDTRAYLSYTYDISDIYYDIEDDPSDSIKALEGENTTSSIKTSIVYDSRDSFFNPTEGFEHRITFQYAGIGGGDIAFTKSLIETGWYIPTKWFIPSLGDITLFLHGKAGYVWESSRGKLPDYELFYLGGMNSLRGFDWQGVHCEDGDGDKIGGHKFVQGNIELLIPLDKKSGFMGVLFFDTGNVYDQDEGVRIDKLNLRETAGFGIRWYSPLGPMRLERGYILDPDIEKGEDSDGNWEFTIGYPF